MLKADAYKVAAAPGDLQTSRHPPGGCTEQADTTMQLICDLLATIKQRVALRAGAGKTLLPRVSKWVFKDVDRFPYARDAQRDLTAAEVQNGALLQHALSEHPWSAEVYIGHFPVNRRRRKHAEHDVHLRSITCKHSRHS